MTLLQCWLLVIASYGLSGLCFFWMLLGQAAEPVAHGTHCCPNFFISFARPASLYSKECTHTHTHTHIYMTACLHMKYSCHQITPQWNIFTQIWSGAKWWLGKCVTLDRAFYSLLFQTGSGSSPSYCHISFLIAFLEEAFIRNINFTMHWLYTVIVICINNNNNNNNVTISNNYGRLQDFILLF